MKDVRSSLILDLYNGMHFNLYNGMHNDQNFNYQGKKKHGSSLLLGLGTGSGDVLLLDVALGQLKWRVQDCHPGLVAITSPYIHYTQCP